MLELYTSIHAFLMSTELLLCCKIGAFALETYILFAILKHLLTKNTKIIWLLITCIVLCTLIIDMNWTLKLLNKSRIVSIPFSFLATVCQIGYPFDIIRYICCIGFLDTLIQKRSTIDLRWYYSLSIATLTTIVTLLCFEFTHTDPSVYTHVISMCYPLLYFYLLLVFLPAIVSIEFTRRSIQLPAILHYQIRIITYYVIAPYIALELLTTNPFTIFTHTPLRSNYLLICLSTIHLAFALYYCIKKMATLRFLNTKQQVTSIHTFTFLKDLKANLDTISHATTEKELLTLTKKFFNDAFGVQEEAVHLIIHTQEPSTHIVKEFTKQREFKQFLMHAKIVLFDEIEFSLFYENDEPNITALRLLESLHAAVFIPLYEKQTLLGYITIDKEHCSRLFTNVDHDEMVVFAGYLTAALNTVRTTQIQSLIKKNKALTEEVYSKTQEIQQHKESIRSFVKSAHEKSIGILLYKNDKFWYGNHSAKQFFLSGSSDGQVAHPQLEKLRTVAETTLRYRKTQSITFLDHEKTTVLVTAIPGIEESQCIMTLQHPEISDIVAAQKELLKDPSALDYLVYLETTRSGQRINQLLPGSHELVLNFKIDLLKLSLSTKAVLLDMADEELMSAVEIIHHISLRKTLHIMALEKPEESIFCGIELFGANPLVGVSNAQGLLETLDETGTLFIKNIHFLSHETQERLAEYLTYGFYYPIHGGKKKWSTVRIIACITDGTPRESLNQNLYKQLEMTTLSLPSSKAQTQKMSIAELKKLVNEHAAMSDSQTTIHHAANTKISDAELAEILKMGKKTLKNKKSMLLLWNTFKNQSKIATLLGVNRSSVHRRYNEYFANESSHDKTRVS